MIVALAWGSGTLRLYGAVSMLPVHPQENVDQRLGICLPSWPIGSDIIRPVSGPQGGDGDLDPINESGRAVARSLFPELADGRCCPWRSHSSRSQPPAMPLGIHHPVMAFFTPPRVRICTAGVTKIKPSALAGLRRFQFLNNLMHRRAVGPGGWPGDTGLIEERQAD